MGAISTTARHLTVVGAGPKAIAIAAKRQVLSENGLHVPKLTVLDPHGVAAHWTGEHGYTDGSLPLGTPPEKDIGFPYTSNAFDREVSRKINLQMLRYSWAAFHVQRGSQSYAEWVDRGKLNPSHEHWAEYLKWVAEELKLEISRDGLAGISVEGDRWELTGSSGKKFETDGLVITSPGPPRSKFEIRGSSDWIFNGKDFWSPKSQQRIRDVGSKGRREACVIGSGETAAAIAVQLARFLSPDSSIDVVSRGGIIYTRGESYEENRLYSNPQRWLEFPPKVREEFVKRTDRGVFSLANKVTLSQANGVETIAGEVRCIEVVGGSLYIEFADGGYSSAYDLVVDATGFRPEWFIDMMDGSARGRLRKAFGANTRLGKKLKTWTPGDALDERQLAKVAYAIGTELAVEKLQPLLYLPMLAALRQGPGFPNLSCLGLLSDRILERHCPRRP